MSAPDEVVERAEQYGAELEDTAVPPPGVCRSCDDYSRLLRGMARRVGQYRETVAVLDDLDAVSAISEGQMARAAGETFTLDDRPAPRPARRVGSFAVSGGPRRLADEEG